MHPIFIASPAAALSALATGLVLRYARRRLLDQVNERSSHRVPTPRGGGLGLVVALLALWPLAAAPVVGLGLGLAWVAIAGMAALGWWDDHADLPARLRLGLQTALAALALAATDVPQIGSLGPWSVEAPSWLAYVLALAGTVWLVNLYNFMDGIDGIAGGQGLVAGAAGGAILGLVGAEPQWSALGWCTAGACAGFLCWNRPPARIFMGDVGSTALGLVFAILVMAQLQAGVALDLALLPLAPFVLDASCTLARRAWRRERLSQAHRSHLYQRLAQHWGSHLPVSLAWSALAAVAACAAWLTLSGRLPAGLAAACVLAVFAALAIHGRRCPA